MFSNLSWYEIAIVLLVALFIFGDKLPKAISDGLRMLRNLRRMARNATADLSRELGTDIQLEDLHPKTFIRKHVLSEADQDELLRPLKAISDDMTRHTRGLGQDFEDLTRQARTTAEEIKRVTETDRGGAVTSLPADPTGPPPAVAPRPASAAEPRASYDDVT